MIYEFGIDPAQLVEWAMDDALCYIALNGLGLGMSRVVARYPYDWDEIVLNAWESAKALAKTEEEQLVFQNQELYFNELRRALSEPTMVERHDLAWKKGRSWIENAKDLTPKHLGPVITPNPCKPSQYVLSGRDFFKAEMWKKCRERLTITRDAATLAQTVAPLLQRARQIHFIDKYLVHEKPFHLQALKAFLDTAKDRGGIPTPLVVVHAHNYDDWALERRQKGYENEISPLVPQGWAVNIRLWKDKQTPLRDKLHNRFILTELGGICFSFGLDADAKGAKDNLHILDREGYEFRWNQYVGTSPAFDRENPTDWIIKPLPPTPPRKQNQWRR